MANQNHPKILIIDDEVNVQDSLKIILNYQGYQVTAVSDPDEGLSLLQDLSYNLVILDLKMPNHDGFDVLSRIRNEYPLIKVIIITGFGTLDIARKALSMGASYYFDKPIDLERFIARVKNAIES